MKQDGAGIVIQAAMGIARELDEEGDVIAILTSKSLLETQ